MRKLPHFLDCGFHKANRDNKNRIKAKKKADETWDAIYGKGETFGEIEVQKPGYVKVTYANPK